MEPNNLGFISINLGYIWVENRKQYFRPSNKFVLLNKAEYDWAWSITTQEFQLGAGLEKLRSPESHPQTRQQSIKAVT